MINVFLDRWWNENWAPVGFHVDILSLFLDEIEGSIDRDFTESLCLHRYDLVSDVNVHILLVQQNTMISSHFPQFATIGAVIMRLRKHRNLDINTIDLFEGDQVVPRSDKISDHLTPSSLEVHFDARCVKCQRKIYHVRQDLPSSMILSRPWILNLYELLSSDEGCIAHELLKKLPHVPVAPKIEDLWTGVESILDSQYFPLSVPWLFSYNFITLLQYLEFKMPLPRGSVMLWDVIDFFIRQINNLHSHHPATAEIKREFVHLIKVAGFDANDLPSPICLRLFSFLVPLLDPSGDRSLSDVAQNLLKRHFPRHIHRFAYRSEYSPLIEFLLFHPCSEIRAFGLTVLDAFVIPSSVLASALEVRENATRELIEAAASHLNDDLSPPAIIEFLLCGLRHPSPLLLSWLCLLRTMLQSSRIPNETCMSALSVLITTFLMVPSPPDGAVFNVAAECFGLLSSVCDKSDPNAALSAALTANHNGSIFRIGGDSAVLQLLFAVDPIRCAIMRYDGDDPILRDLGRLFGCGGSSVSISDLMFGREHPTEFINYVLTGLGPEISGTFVNFPSTVETAICSTVDAIFLRVLELPVHPPETFDDLPLIGALLEREYGFGYRAVVFSGGRWLLIDGDSITVVDGRLLSVECAAVVLAYGRSSHFQYSREYFGLMLRLAECPSNAYADICIRYSVDTLPLSQSSSDSYEFFVVLGPRLRDRVVGELYLSKLLPGWLSQCLCDCAPAVRRGHAFLIERAVSGLNEFDALPLATALASLVSSDRDEVFRALHALQQRFVSVADLCERLGVWRRVLSYVTYGSMCDLTHGLLLASWQRRTSEVCGSAALAGLVRSGSAVHAVARFGLVYGGAASVRSLISAGGLPVSRGIALAFHAIPDCAVELSLSSQFRSGASMADLCDVASVLLALARSSEAFSCILFCKIRVWLGPLLLDGNLRVRDAGLALLSRVVRANADDEIAPARAVYAAGSLAAIAPELARGLTTVHGASLVEGFIGALAVLAPIRCGFGVRENVDGIVRSEGGWKIPFVAGFVEHALLNRWPQIKTAVNHILEFAHSTKAGSKSEVGTDSTNVMTKLVAGMQ
jgi:hypothetical protein